jgi:hypothetical protein
MDRAINPNEAAVVQWLLDHASVGDVTAYRLHQVEELRVVGECDCGCASLNFQLQEWRNASMIADALAVYPDGQLANLILRGREGQIVFLEVCDIDPRAPHRVPEISNLCTWEERGRQLL